MARDTDLQIDAAIEAARSARRRAYVPYSDFPMGAAVVSAFGEVVEGILIENVSLGLAMCAERVALFTSLSQGIRPATLVLCSERTDDALTFPCGACLQVAMEIGGPDLVVVATDPEGRSETTTLRDLAPRNPKRFSPDWE